MSQVTAERNKKEPTKYKEKVIAQKRKRLRKIVVDFSYTNIDDSRAPDA